MLKEIQRGAEKAFLSVDESLRDEISVRFIQFFLQLGPGHGLKTNRARGWANRFNDYLIEGRKAPCSFFGRGILDGYKIHVKGEEFLAKDGGGVFVCNHPADGPLRGVWIMFALNPVVAEVQDWQGCYEARWIQKEVDEDKIIFKTPMGIQRRRYSEMIKTSCEAVNIDLNGSLAKHKRALLDMQRWLKRGGPLVLCPESTTSKTLVRGRPEAGRLLWSLTKDGYPVWPVGLWHERDTLTLNFGNNIDLANSVKNGGGENCKINLGQKIADIVMSEIAKLLPEERRGVYRKII